MLPEPFRMTKQRKIILDEIRKLKSHPTADEMYHLVRKKLPRISLGTVYRNLEMLTQTGFIQKLDVGGSQKRFDGMAHNHYHIRCTRCSRVDDLEIDLDKEIEHTAKKYTDFDIVRHNLEFVGLCPDCK